MPQSLESAVAAVDRSLETGDLLLAFDQACEYLKQFPDAETLKHKGLLALANAGAVERAGRLFREWDLGSSGETHVLALEARIAKERALKTSGRARGEALLASAALYRRLYEMKPDTYLAINLATLLFLAGKRAEAGEVARLVLDDPATIAGADYWALATQAEARLLVGRIDDARSSLEAAAAAGASARARATTRRQLRLILSELGRSREQADALLAPLSVRKTVHYVAAGSQGEGWDAFDGAGILTGARKAIGAALKALDPGAVFGSLGTPAEILFAEEALKKGIELHVVLPLPTDIFTRLFLKDAGALWIKRFQSCCAKAHRLALVAEDPESDDPALADYAARVAMGLALLRAQHLDGEAMQVVLRDSRERRKSAASTVTAAWAKDPRRRHVVVPLEGNPARALKRAQPVPRRCCALVFGDVPGFSGLPDKYLPVFWDTVMKVIGEVVKENEGELALRNTWGDAIHFVVPDVRNAAEICLAVQRRLSGLDGRLLGREGPPTMRIGAHYGPGVRGLGSDRGAADILWTGAVARRAHRADHAAGHRLRDRGLRRDSACSKAAASLPAPMSGRFRSPKASARSACTTSRRRLEQPADDRH